MKRFGVLLFAASVERNLSSYVLFLGRLQTVVGAAVKVMVTDAFRILEGVRLGERFTDVFLTRFKVKRSFRARVARRRLRDIVRSGKDFRGPGSTIKGRQRSGGQVADCIRYLRRRQKPAATFETMSLRRNMKARGYLRVYLQKGRKLGELLIFGYPTR